MMKFSTKSIPMDGTPVLVFWMSGDRDFVTDIIYRGEFDDGKEGWFYAIDGDHWGDELDNVRFWVDLPKKYSKIVSKHIDKTWEECMNEEACDLEKALFNQKTLIEFLSTSASSALVNPL